jgi:Tat protein translocase TatB subunit
VARVAPTAYAEAVFNVGPEKILLILLIALIVLGPRELPEAARKIGNIMGELRRMSAGFQEELRSGMEALSADTAPHPAPEPRVDAPSDPPARESEPGSAA